MKTSTSAGPSEEILTRFRAIQKQWQVKRMRQDAVQEDIINGIEALTGSREFPVAAGVLTTSYGKKWAMWAAALNAIVEYRGISKTRYVRDALEKAIRTDFENLQGEGNE